MALLVISSEPPELLAISDRILTMRDGRLTREVAAADLDEERLRRLVTGASRRRADQ